MDKLQQYAERQRRQYDTDTVSEESARAQVAPDYDQVRREAANYSQFVLSQYFLRHGKFFAPSPTDIRDLRLLDFGCGVGRVMEAFREHGCEHVDGCDISREMLKQARSSPQLTNARFFLSSGIDTGDSPADHYDIAYSFLCFHHIPMRQTRVKILESLSNNLRYGGMVFVEFKVFPGATPAKIPHNHAHWTENMVADRTNSESDVWITPDALGLVYDDFRLFFEDIALLEFDVAANHYQYDPHAIYQFGYNEMFVVGSKGRSLKTKMENVSSS